jgi:hypothetical protein
MRFQNAIDGAVIVVKICFCQVAKRQFFACQTPASLVKICSHVGVEVAEVESHALHDATIYLFFAFKFNAIEICKKRYTRCHDSEHCFHSAGHALVFVVKPIAIAISGFGGNQIRVFFIEDFEWRSRRYSIASDAIEAGLLKFIADAEAQIKLRWILCDKLITSGCAIVQSFDGGKDLT